ncbi:PAS domain-containing sensor histidine kinase [Rhodopseudomonas sp. P2A-2r]|uniref:PAS domain-containing sensor histidine kinase n=1 Tax=unclassified Rhodopseudomonas TaxID=2638247 RepID=UPI002234A841|nr:HWE histidine kinase domain-containing protein [Rhodopseudomonas sp. P2A-2r]UZE48186.1 PAS domain-containing protein [Rhodopseudomonas sp. P2A-2r]
MSEVFVDQSFGPLSDPTLLLRSLLASSGDCIKILDLEGNLEFMTEGGQRIMEVTDFAAIRGCPWPDFWQDQGHIDAKAAVATAKAGGAGHFRGYAATMAGSPRWWDVSVTPIPGPDGKPEKLLSVSRDVTAVHFAEVALQTSEARLAAALNAADTGTWDFDPQTGVLKWDARCYQLFGLTPGKPVSFDVFLAGVHPDDREATDKACTDAMRPDGPQAYDIEFRTIGFEDGIERWCSAKGKSDFENGKAIRFIGTICDISKLKRAEAQQRLLTRELEHRIKNTMAMVGAIANQTFRTAATKEEARSIFDARLHALNQAHDILTRSSWTSASMPTVVDGALAPHRTGEGRIRAGGPAVQLTAKQALSLALALHELATNAAKYGALSVPGGTIAIDWNCIASDKEPLLHFQWREAGGPLVAPPTHRGFGSRLIERTLASDFGNSVKIDYLPEGLLCRFETRLSDLVSAAPSL